jgi:hypothetical protein
MQLFGLRKTPDLSHASRQALKPLSTNGLRSSDGRSVKPRVCAFWQILQTQERERIRDAKPDILLTNFMMLELLMTRQNQLDRSVIANAHGLNFIVLDELHTYRGRQGADVAMLVRRARDRLCPEKPPVCIGTSATMATEGDDIARAQVVANVASRLFGTKITPDAVIGESLERCTDPTQKPAALKQALVATINSELPSDLSDDALYRHPLAIWTELEVGLKDSQRLSRRQPITIAEAAKRLSTQTGYEEASCRAQLQAFLILASRPAKERGGTGERAFMAFKLHRFISGAGHVYSTLRSAGHRRVTLDGQRFDPDDAEARLYQTFFCRRCGQEHHPVVLTTKDGAVYVLPRDIDDTPLDDPDVAERPGYLMPEPEKDDDFTFDGQVESFPEDWLELDRGGAPRLRKDRARLSVNELGSHPNLAVARLRATLQRITHSLPPLSEAGSGSLQEKEKARLEEIIAKVNDLFEEDLTDDDQLVYVNNVIKGKLLESQELVLQASNNTKAQFANSPTLSKEIMNAVMDALAAHNTMSKQAIDSERVREGLKDVLLGPGQLYEALRDRAGGAGEVVGE